MDTRMNAHGVGTAGGAYRWFDIVMAGFVTVLLISNIASSAKILDWGVSLFGLRLSFDAGTLVFPISYIFADILTEVYGYRKSRRVIWTGFVCLGFSSLILWLVRIMPGEADWQARVGQDAFVKVLDGMSSGGIVIASLAAYFAGEFSNSFILAKMKIATKGRWLWTRTIGSTLVGEGIDTFAFITVATLFGVFPWSGFLSLTVTNYIFKCSVEAAMTPITYRIVRFLKKSEGVDFYDRGTNFNPFLLKG
jgi:uncharacterized integral membrane protein (TIGR00697 family)